MPRDYYQVLGVDRNASQEDIKSAYRKMSKEWHPDKHKGDKAAEEKFKEINEAYEVLSNAKKRQQFDQFGTAGSGGGGGFGNGFGGFDFSSFTGGDASGFADIFESFFGGGGRGRERNQEKGSDRELELAIDFAEVVTGAEHILKVKKLVICDACEASGAEPGSKIVTCSTCEGTGQITRTAQSFFGTVQQRVVCPQCRGSGKIPEQKCKKCDGEGRVSATADIKVKVPAGIHEGQTLRLQGEGDPGRRGAQAGDLYVNIHVRTDERFMRDGDDIRTDETISFLDAALGTESEIDTVHGKATLKIPEGTQPEQVFRIKGKGLPILSTSRTGDHYVRIHIEVPRKLTKQERKLLEEWKSIR